MKSIKSNVMDKETIKAWYQLFNAVYQEETKDNIDYVIRDMNEFTYQHLGLNSNDNDYGDKSYFDFDPSDIDDKCYWHKPCSTFHDKDYICLERFTPRQKEILQRLDQYKEDIEQERQETIKEKSDLIEAIEDSIAGLTQMLGDCYLSVEEKAEIKETITGMRHFLVDEYNQLMDLKY